MTRQDRVTQAKLMSRIQRLLKSLLPFRQHPQPPGSPARSSQAVSMLKAPKVRQQLAQCPSGACFNDLSEHLHSRACESVESTRAIGDLSKPAAGEIVQKPLCVAKIMVDCFRARRRQRRSESRLMLSGELFGVTDEAHNMLSAITLLVVEITLALETAYFVDGEQRDVWLAGGR